MGGNAGGRSGGDALPAAAQLLLSPEERTRIERLPVRDAGHGYDEFGLERGHVALALAGLKPLHRHYFRVRSHGVENIPARGAAILAGNHSGTLPFDAAMVWTDVLLGRGRVARAVADHFVSAVPFFGTFATRAGMVSGSHRNLSRLLERGELVLIFPEGVPGIAKPFRERYHLQEWRVGHAELSIRHRAPVIPLAVVGAEEQMPLLGRLVTPGKWLGLPYLPVAPVLLPLPVRYHVVYGEPLHLYEGHTPADADEPEVVHAAAAKVKDAVAALIQRGLDWRRGIFQ